MLSVHSCTCCCSLTQLVAQYVCVGQDHTTAVVGVLLQGGSKVSRWLGAVQSPYNLMGHI